jgi:hypothetical protein
MHPEIRLARDNAKRDLAEGWEVLNRLIKEYLDGYEFRGEGGDHVPTEDERELLNDVIAGLIADGEFCAAIARNYARQRLLQSLPAADPPTSMTGTPARDISAHHVDADTNNRHAGESARQAVAGADR